MQKATIKIELNDVFNHSIKTTRSVTIYILDNVPKKLENKKFLAGGGVYLENENIIVCITSKLDTPYKLKKCILHELLHFIDTESKSGVNIQRYDSKNTMWWDVKEMRAQAIEFSSEILDAYNSMKLTDIDAVELEKITNSIYKAYNIHCLTNIAIVPDYGKRRMWDF